MIGVSGTTSHFLDQEITTDGVLKEFTFPLTSIADGGIVLIAVSMTTSSTNHCSYLLALHKQNNIGANVAVLSPKEYGTLKMTFTATFTAMTITLSTALVGNLKISPLIMNA